jgi:hypothetical protein
MKESPLNLLPVVLRARDFRLYTQGGGRLVDLWQGGGGAILGHTPPGVLRSLKNCASRGLFTPLPHPQEGRLLKALTRILPNRAFRLYRDRISLYRALEAARSTGGGPFPAGFSGPSGSGDAVLNSGDPPGPGPCIPGPLSSMTGFWEQLPDPAFPPAGTGDRAPVPGVSLWRPFLDPAPEGGPPQGRKAGIPFLVPVLPWPLAPWVLALDPALDGIVSPSDPVPPVLLAAATRAVYDLIAAGPRGGRPVYPKINHVLYGTSSGTKAPPPAGTRDTGVPGAVQNPWRRRGIYLTLPEAGAGWEALFRRFLAGGFLIPPGPREPLILPGILSPGEETKLAALLESCGPPPR